MYFSAASPLAALIFLGSLAGSVAGKALQNAADRICIQDAWNLALSSFRADASPFCSSFIQIPAVTLTVATITPTVTSIPTRTSFATVTVRTIGTITQTVTALVTTTIQLPPLSPIVKRDGNRVADVSVWEQRAQSIASVHHVPLHRRQVDLGVLSSLSSACSCLRVSTATTRVTAAATPLTRVISAIDQRDTTTVVGRLTSLTTIVVVSTVGPINLTTVNLPTGNVSASVPSTPSLGLISILSPRANDSLPTGSLNVSTSSPLPSLTGITNVTTVSIPTITLTSTSLRPNLTSLGSVVNVTVPTLTAPSIISLPTLSPTSACTFTLPVINPGFETHLGDISPPWVVRANSDAIRFVNLPGSIRNPAFSGSRHARIVSNGTLASLTLSQSLSICSDSIYDFSAWTRISRPDSGCVVTIRVGGFPVAFMSTPSAPNNYDQVMGQFGPVPAGFVDLVILVTCLGPSNGVVDIDDITLVIKK